MRVLTDGQCKRIGRMEWQDYLVLLSIHRIDDALTEHRISFDLDLLDPMQSYMDGHQVILTTTMPQ